VPFDMMGGCPVCSNQGLADIPMAYSLVASAPRTRPALRVLVDCGFRGGQSMTGSRFQSIEGPDEVLAKVGLAPADIDVLVLTHLHFDHAGNFAAFPNARVIVQRREFEQWRRVLDGIPDRSAGKSMWELSSLDAGLIDDIAGAVAAGRIELIDGDTRIAPGIDCRLAADSHTFGSQWVEVQTRAGPHVIAGDCVYWYRNLESMWPPGYAQGNPWNLLGVYRRLQAVVGAGRLDRVVPGHDMEIFSRHPHFTVGLNPVAEIHLASGERSRAAAASA